MMNGRSDLVFDQRSSSEQYHSPPASEQFYFPNGNRADCQILHEVQAASVIRDLNASVWIRSNRVGLRLQLRVVLPRTSPPNAGGPVRVLVSGPAYTNVNQWQNLSFDDRDLNITRLVEEEVWRLRSLTRQPVDGGGAYVDTMILNVAPGAGPGTVWLDDPQLTGHVIARAAWDEREFAEADEAVQLAEFETPFDKQPSLVTCSGTVLEVHGQPFFVRSIQFNGEPLDFLQSLGFNTIELSEPPTDQQLAEARSLRLWLIAPPPASVGLQPIGPDYDCVLAWNVARDATAADLPNIESLAREIRHSDCRAERPLVACVAADDSQLARRVDILAIGHSVFGGGCPTSEYAQFLATRARAIRREMPIWATIPSEVPAALEDQILALGARLPPLPLDHEQCCFAAYEAIAGGARGIRFLSRNRLDAGDPATRLRAVTLRWLNQQLAVLEESAASGAVISDLGAASAAHRVTVLKTPRARLVLIQRPTGLESFSGGGIPLATVSLASSLVPAGDRVYAVDDGRLTLVPPARGTTQAEIRVDDCAASTALIVTQDPALISRLAGNVGFTGPQLGVQAHWELVQQWTAFLQLVDRELGRVNRSSADASRALSEVIDDMRAATTALNGGTDARAALRSADLHLAVARREILTAAREGLTHTASNPLVHHVAAVPLHWQIVQASTQSAWQANALAGGDFEDLEWLTSNGWLNHRSHESWVDTQVELSGAAARAGRRGLLLAAHARGGDAQSTVVETPPLRITSGPIAVRAGQLINIHGWVRIDQPLEGNASGLVVSDSLAGPDLAVRIRATRGWEEFNLYRAARNDGPLTVSFALDGLGQAMIDEVTVRSIDLTAPQTAGPTEPTPLTAEQTGDSKAK